MPLEKNYAILEIQKILLDAREVAEQNQDKTDEDLYLAITKAIYPQLEQIFRLVFEPVFNEEFNKQIAADAIDPKYLEQVEAERSGLRENVKRLQLELEEKTVEVEELLNANQNIHTNFSEHIENYKEQISWLRKVVGSAVSLNYSIGGKNNG